MSIIGATILETAAGNASGKTVQLNVSVLKAQAKQLSAIKESYCALKNNISETLKTVDGAWSAQLQSTFSGIMDEQMKEMAYFERQLDIGISAANYVANNFSGKDEELAGNLDISIADGVKELEREKRVAENAARAIEMSGTDNRYDGKEYADWNGSGYSRSYTGVNIPHCTWYASSRYEVVNGEPLIFKKGVGDANTWPKYIHEDYFNCDEANSDTIKTNTIAVSVSSEHSPTANLWDSRIGDKGDWIGASANHVAYVEAVQDGYVYYSEGSSSWAMGNEGYVYKMTVKEFAEEYDFIISRKKQER